MWRALKYFQKQLSSSLTEWVLNVKWNICLSLHFTSLNDDNNLNYELKLILTDTIKIDKFFKLVSTVFHS
jgi:hypothetical protein